MSRKIELLAPGGDTDSIKAAIAAGADAVYCGLNKFNARNRAENISFDQLNGILRLAHQHNCEVFLTLNIGIVEPEIPDLFRLLSKLVNTSIDGVIIQDLGLFYILSTYFKGLKIHASTQLTTHNQGQIKFLNQLNATRVNLSRELNLNEIKSLNRVAHQNNLLSEVFVHGSYCISFSGICYMSSVFSGNSGNRGRCSQPCRDEYTNSIKGTNFPLNLKDNSAWNDLQELADAGVDSFKIEGRIKKFHYVYSVVDAYRKKLKNSEVDASGNIDSSILYKVFNRDFSNGFLKGTINKKMFIDNPRDNSSTHWAKQNGEATPENIDKAELALYTEKGEMRSAIKKQIARMSIERAPAIIAVNGNVGAPLQVTIKTPESSFTLFSDISLATNGSMPIDKKMLLKRFKAINETEYFIEEIDITGIQEKLFIPFSELTTLKNRILLILNNSRETVEAVPVPKIAQQKQDIKSPELLVLINSVKDIDFSEQSSAVFYFQLPNDFSNQTQKLIKLFYENRKLIPWFPSILIGENYTAALEFLRAVQPAKIVSNNTGIAYDACKMNIAWIAGPFLNTMNSYSLLSLKKNFNCSGAFISNELSKQQIQGIKKPADFHLYYSIYHPVVLMTSRQCLFQTTAGCEKNTMDKNCVLNCSKSTNISNLKGDTFYIQKSKGNYNTIYNAANFLNTEILDDIPNRFSGFLIDLREIKTETKTELNKSQLLSLFNDCIEGKTASKQDLHNALLQTTNTQYRKGI
jgi:putative protease